MALSMRMAADGGGGGEGSSVEDPGAGRGAIEEQRQLLAELFGLAAPASRAVSANRAAKASLERPGGEGVRVGPRGPVTPPLRPAGGRPGPRAATVAGLGRRVEPGRGGPGNRR